MRTPRIAVFAASVLTALAAATAAASPALADTSVDTTPSAVPVVQQAPNAYELTLNIAGVGVTIDYTLTSTGSLESATASVGGSPATATAAGNEIHVLLTGGTAVSVELGNGGTTVASVNTETPDATATESASPEPQSTDTPEAASTESASPEPQSTDTPEAAQSPSPEASSSPDTHSGDTAGATSTPSTDGAGASSHGGD